MGARIRLRLTALGRRGQMVMVELGDADAPHLVISAADAGRVAAALTAAAAGVPTVEVDVTDLHATPVGWAE
jgi:hypothetical protein